MKKKTYEGILEFEKMEDGGQALLTELHNSYQDGEGMFVRVQSWSEKLDHSEIQNFLGKKVRITVEVVEE